MADLIEFPGSKVAPDFLPEPGNRYEAYGRALKVKPVSLSFVFADWSMTSLPYAGLQRLKLRSLDGSGNPNGECVLTLVFGGKRGDYAALATITGHDLYEPYWATGEHLIHWFWEMPKTGAAVPEGSPVVHTIDIREGDSRTVAALLAGD
jgi:hypothetical protein